MAELKKTLSDIAKSIVDNPDAVIVTGDEEGDDVSLTLSVASVDIGKVIGKQGKIAKSIRMVMKSAANLYGKHVTVDIDD